MRHQKFKDLIKAYTNIENELADEMVAGQKKLLVKAGDYLLRSGEICKSSFFVERGLLRYYSIDGKGKEHILQFAPENWFIADRESALSNQPSSYFIDALEDSTVLIIKDDFLLNMAAKHPQFAAFQYKLLQNHIRSLQNRINQLLSYTAEERYLELISTYPNIQLRVSQMMIASYLGITPESLSRVRSEIARNHMKR